MQVSFDESSFLFFAWDNTLFFCKTKLYKNSEAEIGQKIRTNFENFEAEICKYKKK